MPTRRRALGRPRGDTLDQEQIVAVARQLARTGATLTMGALAADLDVTPMALYRHVTNKEQLLALLLDDVSSEIVVPAGDGSDWEPRLRRFHREVTDALALYPSVGQELFRLPPLENSGRLLEGYIQILLDAGADDTEAILAYTTLYYLAIGTMASESAGRPPTPCADPPPEYVSPLLDRLVPTATALSRNRVQDYAIDAVVTLVRTQVGARAAATGSSPAPRRQPRSRTDRLR